jgi:FdhD protein
LSRENNKSLMEAFVPVRLQCGAVEKTRDLIGEAPVAIVVQDRLYATLLCTPGEAAALAAGFCLSEGLIVGPQDLASIQVDGSRVYVVLAPGRLAVVRPRLDALGLPAPLDIDLKDVPPLTDGPGFDPAAVRARLDGLDALQPLRMRTRAAHAAALYDERLDVLSIAEDVGRHNALDKAVGKLLCDGRFDRIRLLVLSSRISFEMVQKAARARVAVVAAVSRPTALAVALATRLNLTLANPDGTDGLCVYCGAGRLGRSNH